MREIPQDVFFSGAVLEEEPMLLFDNADTSAIHKEPYYGLKAFGPLDKQCRTLKTYIITPRSTATKVEAFVQTLQGGDSKFFAGGMKKFFRTDLKINGVVITEGSSVKDYIESAEKFVETTSLEEANVVICFIPQTSNFYTNTPYYRLKAILSIHGFPSQMLTENTLAQATYAYLNVASAIFAKSGHTPWALGAEMPNTDMVIGISVADRICDSKRLLQNRYIGYVNVFDQFGKWMFFEGIANSYSRKDIPVKMAGLAKRAVEKYQIEKGVQPEKIHIHYWKRFSNAERRAVIQTLCELNANIRIAFTSIDSSHPFRFYDLESSDGSLMRGHYIYFGDDILLSTTGTSTELKRTYRMGTPKLLHIKTDQYPNNFISRDELAYQILALTKLNWATTSVLIREPITLTFSHSLAYLTSVITESEWREIQTGTVNVNMRNKAWFI